MRGAFLVVILVTALIIGILVVKDMTTETAEDTTRVQSIDRAHEAEEATRKSTEQIRDAERRLNERLPNQSPEKQQ